MLSSASVLMLSMLLLTNQNLGLVMGPSLLPSLVEVSSQLGYHTVHSQRKKLGDSLISLSYFLLPLITLFSAHIVRWCAESNRPLTMIKDRQFIMLMKAGCPCSTLPLPRTISQGTSTMLSTTVAKAWTSYSMYLTKHYIFSATNPFLNRDILDIYTLLSMHGLL